MHCACHIFSMFKAGILTLSQICEVCQEPRTEEIPWGTLCLSLEQCWAAAKQTKKQMKKTTVLRSWPHIVYAAVAFQI